MVTRRRPVQLELRARTWGGRRKGAGRPKTVGIVLHRTRPEIKKRHPLHITLRVRHDVGNLRRDNVYAQMQKAFLAGHNRFGMRMCEFSIQSNHIHLVVEAEDKQALTSGLQGLIIRLARAINRALGRKGKVFAERYHERILKTPTEVRNAVEYVRHNHEKHLKKSGRDVHPFYIDPYSSMSGQAVCYMHDYDWSTLVIAAPKTWLLNRLVSRKTC
jgi:REP element-mobilizing transposase RayT